MTASFLDLAAIECSLVGLALRYRVAVAMYVIKPHHDEGGGPQSPQRARPSSTVYVCAAQLDRQSTTRVLQNVSANQLTNKLSASQQLEDNFRGNFSDFVSRFNAMKGFMAAEENIPFTPTNDTEANEKAMMNALEQLDGLLSG